MSFKPIEYMRSGFNHNGRLYYGIAAFFLYTLGYVRYHMKRSKE